MGRLEPGFALEIEDSLLRKASGVFIWIFLIINALLRCLGEYKDRQTLISTIDALPSDLEKLHNHIFASLSKGHRQDGSVLLQPIARAPEAQQAHLTAL